MFKVELDMVETGVFQRATQWRPGGIFRTSCEDGTIADFDHRALELLAERTQQPVRSQASDD